MSFTPYSQQTGLIKFGGQGKLQPGEQGQEGLMISRTNINDTKRRKGRKKENEMHCVILF